MRLLLSLLLLTATSTLALAVTCPVYLFNVPSDARQLAVERDYMGGAHRMIGAVDVISLVLPLWQRQ